MIYYRVPNCIYIVTQSIKDVGVDNIIISTNTKTIKPVESRIN